MTSSPNRVSAVGAILLLLVFATLSAVGCGGKTQQPLRNFASSEDEPERSQPVAKDNNPVEEVVASARPVSTAVTTATPVPAPSPPPMPTATLSELIRPKRKPSLVSADEHRRVHIENMEKIAKALLRYAEDKGKFPVATLNDPLKRPTLSWRVEILPYLGYQELYEQFDLNRAWSADSNYPLLAKMPAEYRDPNRVGYTTNYLLPVGVKSAFNPRYGIKPSVIADGLDKTLILVEADSAVPWTKPQDWPVSRVASGVGLDAEEAFYVAWGDGKVGRMKAKASPHQIYSATTIAGKESFDRNTICDVVGEEAAAQSEPADLAGTAEPAREITEGTGDADQIADTRAPIPQDGELSIARAKIKEIFGKRYAEAQDAKARSTIAEQLVDEAEKSGTNLAARYALLQTSLKIAMETGDSRLAASTIIALSKNFQVDAYPLRVELLKSLYSTPQVSSSRTGRGAQNEILTGAIRLMNEAIDRDDYEVAREMHEIALTTARRQKNGPQVALLSDKRTDISRLSRAYDELRESFADGTFADDPETAQTAGIYFCLLKEDWQKGLPLLAIGTDDNLRRLASRELSKKESANDQLKLADAWWEQSENRNFTTTERGSMKTRACYWYRKALPLLEPGLDRLRAEMRAKNTDNQVSRNR